VKRYFVDGVRLQHWSELLTIAKGYGFTSTSSSLSITSEAIAFLKDSGHTVEEKDVADPKLKIDETFAWCEDHPTTRYDYTKYEHCYYCEKRIQKRKRFFALSRENGLVAEVSKARAKAHFEVESFNDLTIDQLDWLINRLEQQRARKGGEHKTI